MAESQNAPAGPDLARGVSPDELENDMLLGKGDFMQNLRSIATPSTFVCPECHGALFERQDGTIVRYRCRTGHAFSPDTLAAAQSKGVEDALWIALRALEENAALLRRLANRARERGQERSWERFASQASGVEARARIIRDALLSGKPNVA